jgi:hypothetical protein
MGNYLGRAAVLVFTICLQSALFGQAKAPEPREQKLTALVPFVGCKSDGQVEPRDAPTGKSKAVPISAQAAQRLAFYSAAEGLGVLAPRGWHCFGTYGSSGKSLFVSPQPIGAADLFSSKWKGFTGPVIELSQSIGDTSGRFEVAKVIARVFPAYKAFVQQVVEEGIEPASSFPFGPFPTDKLKYRSKETVEYQTPANMTGLGTSSMLQSNASPICGAAILAGQTPHLVFLAVRLSPDLIELAPAIVSQVERDGIGSSD